LKEIRQVTLERISIFEEQRKLNPNLQYEELDRRSNVQSLKEVQLKYYDANHYNSIFTPLIRLEEE